MHALSLLVSHAHELNAYNSARLVLAVPISMESEL